MTPTTAPTIAPTIEAFDVEATVVCGVGAAIFRVGLEVTGVKATTKLRRFTGLFIIWLTWLVETIVFNVADVFSATEILGFEGSGSGLMSATFTTQPTVTSSLRWLANPPRICIPLLGIPGHELL